MSDGHAAQGTSVQREVLRLPEFRTFWLGDSAARLGQQTSMFALPLLVVVVLQGSGTQVGLVSGAQSAPILVLSLLVGALAGRVQLRRVMVAWNLVRGAALFGVGAVAATERLTVMLLVVAAVVVGSAGVVHDISAQVAAPRLFRGDRLVAANSILQGTTSFAQMAGPAVAGYLIQLAGAPAAAVAAGVVLCGAGAAMSALPAAQLRPVTLTVRAVVRSGLAFIWRCRPIRDLCLQSALFNLHQQAFVTVFLLFGIRTMGLPGGLVGILIGMGSLGALAGSLAAGRYARRWHLGRTLTGAILLAALGLLVVPVMSITQLVALLGAGFVVNGAALAAYNVLAITLRQELPPPDLLGSVTAGYRMAAFGSLALGGFVGGVLADVAGSRVALWVIALSAAVCSLLLFLSPVRRIRTVGDAHYAM